MDMISGQRSWISIVYIVRGYGCEVLLPGPDPSLSPRLALLLPVSRRFPTTTPPCSMTLWTSGGTLCGACRGALVPLGRSSRRCCSWGPWTTEPTRCGRPCRRGHRARNSSGTACRMFLHSGWPLDAVEVAWVVLLSVARDCAQSPGWMAQAGACHVLDAVLLMKAARLQSFPIFAAPACFLAVMHFGVFCCTCLCPWASDLMIAA